MLRIFSKMALCGGCCFFLLGCAPSASHSTQTKENYPEPTTAHFTATLPSKLSNRQLQLTVDKCFYFDFNPNPNGISLKYPLASFSDSSQIRFECLKDKEAYTQLDIDAIPERELLISRHEKSITNLTNLDYILRYYFNAGALLIEKNNIYALYKISPTKMMLVVFGKEYKPPFVVLFVPNDGKNTGYFDDQYEIITILNDQFSLTYQIYGSDITNQLSQHATENVDFTRQFQEFFSSSTRTSVEFTEIIREFSKINQSLVLYFSKHSIIN